MEQSKFYQIKNVTGHEYTLVGCDGSVITRPIQDVDKSASAFTIQDAKDGDVLSDGTTIFIFKDLLSDGSVMSYCDYNTDSGESDAFCPLLVNLMCLKITPATKEQRDLLFAKMKEAGYEWDIENKKIKNIDSPVLSNSSNTEKDEPTKWSEEDELHIRELESLVKKAWAIAELENDKDTIHKMSDLSFFLKTLKPQKQWKPSEEQIRALHDLNLTGNISYAGQGQFLVELYNDLKKL